LQGGTVGLGIGILLLQQVEALLHHSTHRGEATTRDLGPGEGVLVGTERHRTLDRHPLNARESLTA
jgi:hypothetical protein